MLKLVHFLFLGLLTASAPGLHAQRCRPPQAQAPSPAQAPGLEPGVYQLTLVASSGPRRGHSVRGTITLWEYQRFLSQLAALPIPIDTAHTPLFGSARIDFRRVAAPVPMAGAPSTPRPDSPDPIRPGVLVRRTEVDSAHPRATYQMLIGTLANRRDREPNEVFGDGEGIFLDVYTLDSLSRLATGRWDAYGIVRGGAGYFCAEWSRVAK